MAKRKRVTPIGDLRLTEALSATRLATGVARSTQWPTETWVIWESDTRTPVNQFELYKHKGSWFPWTASIIRGADKRVAEKLAEWRNRI